MAAAPRRCVIPDQEHRSVGLPNSRCSSPLGIPLGPVTHRVAAWEHGIDLPDVDGILKFGKQGIGEFARAGFV
jgi:hypothetical protein